MKIFDTDKDIMEDLSISEQRHSRRRYSLFGSGRRESTGLFFFLLPQISGFIIGLALCRLIGLGGAAYVVSGCICAVLGGTVHNMLRDTMSFTGALLRNILIIIPIAVIVGITIALDD